MSHPNTPEPGPQYTSAKDAKAHAASEKAYRKASRPWFKKKRTWILGAILLLVLASCLGGMAGGGSSSTPSSTGGDTEQTTPEQTEAPAEAAFPGAEDGDVIGSAGDALTLGAVQVTATELVAGDATLGPTVCTTASMVNNSEETVDFNTFDWKLQAPSGTILNSGFAGSDNQLSAGQIAPGGTATGDVCFDGGEESGQYVLLYEPIFSFFSDRGAWINNR